jgi:hypothetical protein
MPVNKYDKLDFLLNIYYDLVYRPVPQRKYRFDPIDLNKIELNDLKKDKTFDYSHILDGAFKYIGTYNSRLHFKRKTDPNKQGHPCHVMIGSYKKTDAENKYTGVLQNVAMMYALTENVINEKNKHFLLPVMFFDITLDKFEPHIKDLSKLLKKASIETTENDQLYCLVTEHFFKMMTLGEYLKLYNAMSEEGWKVLLFQVFYALYKLTAKFTGFRHNNLNLDSIMVYIKDASDEVRQYKISSYKFNVPNAGFDIMITDFDKAYTKDYTQKTNKAPQENMYYDLHYFASYLRLWANENNITIPRVITSLLETISPASSVTAKTSAEFNGLDESLNINSISDMTPLTILKKNNIFDTFKSNIQMDMSATPLANPEMSVQSGGDSEYSVSDYKTSITDTDLDGIRLLGINTAIHNRKLNKQNFGNKNISAPNTSSMPKKSGMNDRYNSADSDSTYSDILENADTYYAEQSKKVSNATNSNNTKDKTLESYTKKLRQVATQPATVGNKDIFSKEQSKAKKTNDDFSSISSMTTTAVSSDVKNKTSKRLARSDKKQLSSLSSISDTENDNRIRAPKTFIKK